MKRIILAFFIFPLFMLESNNIEILKDSLLEYSGEDRAVAFYNIGIYYYLNNNDSAILYIDRALTEYKKIANEKGVAKSYSALGSIYANCGIFDTASVLLYNVIEWGEENNDEIVFFAYFELANMFDNMGQNA